MEGHPEAETQRICSAFRQRLPRSACMPPGTGSSLPKCGPSPPTPRCRAPRAPCPLRAAPGQVAAGPALQQDDLAAQGAEAPLGEEATEAALQGEGRQAQDALPHALQQLVQVLFEEELRAEGKY